MGPLLWIHVLDPDYFSFFHKFIGFHCVETLDILGYINLIQKTY
jgi:hypothetical protein